MSRKGPTKAEWDEKKELIAELYLRQNLTLKDVLKTLKVNHGFVVSERQYKTKLKAWRFDDKKIKGPLYKAMSVVMATHRTPTVNISFEVPYRGSDLKHLTYEDITKQMRRNTQPHMDLSEANAIIRKRRIRIIAETVQNGMTRSRAANVQFSSPPSITGPFPDSPLTSGRTTPMTSTTSTTSVVQPANRAKTPEQADSTSLPSFQRLFSNLRSVPESSRHMQIERPTRILPPVLPTARSDEFDVLSAFGALSLDPSCDYETRQKLQQCIGRSFHGDYQTLSEEKRLAVNWLAYYVSKFLPNYQARFDATGQRRREAIAAFETLLAQHSQYIFPYCNFMLTVLASNEEKGLLKDFLTDCCSVIDRNAANRPSSYDSPFHFALALYTKNQRDVDHHSPDFERSNEAIGVLWGRSSPNYLVNQYHFAWHKTSQKRYDEALRIIHQSLPISEQVMGHQHIVTINCVAILARIYEELGDNSAAIHHLEDASNRLGDPAEVLLAYQHRLLRRLAMLQMKEEDFHSAQQHLDRVVDFRLRRFGILSPSTWNVIYPYRELLQAQGRHAEASAFITAMEQRHQSQV